MKGGENPAKKYLHTSFFSCYDSSSLPIPEIVKKLTIKDAV